MCHLNSCINIFIFLSCLSLFSSCQPIARVLFGVHSINTVDDDKIQAFYADVLSTNIDFEVLKLKMDSTQFETYRRLGLTGQHKKDLSQPVQMLYFKQDTIVAFYANCYAKGGLGNLKWNHAGDFDSFPMKSAKVFTEGDYPALSVVESVFDQEHFEAKPYTILFLWTRGVGKVAGTGLKEVINTIQEYEFPEEVQLVLINTDGFYKSVF